jgi:hypothetical protein
MSLVTKIESTEDGYILLNNIVKTRLVETREDGQAYFDIIFDREIITEEDANLLVDKFIDMVTNNAIDEYTLETKVN